MTVSSLTLDGAAQLLAETIDDSVSRSVRAGSRVAIAFSGGLDSSVIAACAKRRAKVVACCASLASALDGERAKNGAELLGIDLLPITLTPTLVEVELCRMRLPFHASLMDRSLWCLYSIVSQRAAESGAEAILLGQMADELFGGYAKYQRVLNDSGEAAAAAMMESDLEEYVRKGMPRDVDACSRWLQPIFPFSDQRVVELGESLPVAFKISKGVRKAVLRKAALALGVPPDLARAPKKAAQYSSGIQKVARRLTLLTARPDRPP